MSLLYCRDHTTSKFWRFFRGCTIDMNFDFRRWKKHQRASRHLVLWKPWNIVRGDNIRRLIFPDLVTIGAVAGLISYYNRYVASAEEVAVVVKHGFNLHLHHAMLSLPLECFSITSVALGLLVTFKTQTAYARYTDGRSQWGLMINECRSLTSRVLTRLPSHGAILDERTEQAQMFFIKLLRSVPVTLKYHLTEDGCNPHILIKEEMSDAEVRERVDLALQAEMEGIWKREDEQEWDVIQRLMEAEHRPTFVLHELSHLNASVFANPLLGGLHPMLSAEIDRSIFNLYTVLGNCEKILRTPVYTPYTKFTSRFLFMWCNLLPLALYPIVGPVGTAPVTLIVSFFLLGIEDIGSRVEQPFDVMPLWQYCQILDQSVVQQLNHSGRLRDTRAPRAPDVMDSFSTAAGDENIYSLGDRCDKAIEGDLRKLLAQPVSERYRKSDAGPG